MFKSSKISQQYLFTQIWRMGSCCQPPQQRDQEEKPNESQKIEEEKPNESQKIEEEKPNESQKIIHKKQLAFGKDLPTQVSPGKMKDILHRHIVAIKCRITQTDYLRGTGLLISRNLVLTCAHNVVYQSKDVDKNNIEIHVNPNGILAQFQRVQSIYVPNQYRKAGQNSFQSSFYDYALIKLEEKSGYPSISLQEKIGYVNYLRQKNYFIRLKAIDQSSQAQRNEMKVSIFGYPFINYNKIGSQQSVYQSGMTKTGRIQSIDVKNQSIWHTISTREGHSGSPIIEVKEKDFEIAIIAIHQGGIYSVAGSSIANQGRLITEKGQLLV